MADEVSISLEEWRAEIDRLESLQVLDTDYFTSMELRAKLNVGQERLKDLLYALRDAKRLEVNRMRRAGIDGVARSVPVYRIRMDEKKGKPKKR